MDPHVARADVADREPDDLAKSQAHAVAGVKNNTLWLEILVAAHNRTQKAAPLIIVLGEKLEFRVLTTL
jgi:hypothetical protein